jgi:hypothetical protein
MIILKKKKEKEKGEKLLNPKMRDKYENRSFNLF